MGRKGTAIFAVGHIVVHGGTCNRARTYTVNLLLFKNLIFKSSAENDRRALTFLKLLNVIKGVLFQALSMFVARKVPELGLRVLLQEEALANRCTSLPHLYRETW